MSQSITVRLTLVCRLAIVCVLAIPSAAMAQASIAGVVRDTSGAVLPGVTVEASSPALIEKVRSVVTDGDGQYRIVDLRPGTYAVTFGLQGFRTVRREGIELTGSFVATVNVDLPVGALEETVTVTGESPIIDVQSARQQQVIGQDVIETVPVGRTHFAVAALVPALSTNNPADAGGSNALAVVSLTAHGSRTTDQRIALDGLSTNSSEGAGQFSSYSPNMSSAQEIAVNYAGGTAEMETGGVLVNVIPRDGGNRFAGIFFAGGTSGALQGGNLTDELRARRFTTDNGIVKLWDFNPGVGGPIRRDQLWFYASWRYNGEETNTGGFTNANAGRSDRWTYALSDERARFWHDQRSLNLRVTWQINQKHKLSGFYDNNKRCLCPSMLTAVNAPESASYVHSPVADLQSFTWSSPQTNRLLFEAGIQRHPEQWHSANVEGYTFGAGGLTPGPEGQLRPTPQFIPVSEQSTGASYRGRSSYRTVDMGIWRSRASTSYVTGSHSFKVGLTYHRATRDDQNWAFGSADAAGENLAYRFNNGVPNQLTQYLYPVLIRGAIDRELAVFVQDQWTLGRMSISGGLRYDHLATSHPEAHLGPTRFAPTRDITIARRDQLRWHDVVPRVSAVYDLFGNGRTAVKGVLNKYVNAVGLQGFFGDGSNPVNLYGIATSRAWNDANGDFVPDCDLTSPGANGECGAMANQRFGQSLQTARVNPELLRGWGKRAYNWEVSASVQQQLTPRVALDVGFFRRWYGNFIARDNLATDINSYDVFSVSAPSDSRLPNGGGYAIGPLYDLKPAYVGLVDDYYTFASDYGKQVQNWQGVDVALNTRLTGGVILQAGLSSGRTILDNCAVLAMSPEIESSLEPASPTTTTGTVELARTVTAVPYCRQDSGYLTSLKGFGSYTIPLVRLQVSATLQSYDAPAAAGTTNPIQSMAQVNYVATNAVIAPSLGRNLSGGAANATVNLIAPGTVRGDRVNQFDLSFAKVLQRGQTRTTARIDVYNVFNGSFVLTETNTYAAFRQPQSILQARFVKFGMQFDF